MLLVHYIDGIRTKFHALFSDPLNEPYSLRPNHHRMNQLLAQFDRKWHFQQQSLSRKAYVIHGHHQLHNLLPLPQLVLDKNEYRVGNPIHLSDVRRCHLCNRRNRHALFGHHQNRMLFRLRQLIQ